MNVSAPYGLRPYSDGSTGDANHPLTQVAMPSDINRALAVGDIVSVTAGALGIPAATPTTTRDANTPFGIVRGIYWTKAPANGQSLAGDYIPANAITAGYGGVTVLVQTAPDLLYTIAATANTGVATAVGKNAALTIGTADPLRKQSTTQLNAATIAATATLAVRIVGVLNPGDTYPEYIVRWNAGVHQFANPTGA